LLREGDWPNSIAISPNGKRLLITSYGRVVIYDSQFLNLRYSFRFPSPSLHRGFGYTLDLIVDSASFSHDGTEIVVVTGCHAVILKDLFYEKEKNNMLAYLQSQPAVMVGGYVNQKIFEYFKPIPWNGRDDGTTIESTFELPE
jgi:hypothetical protein